MSRLHRGLKRSHGTQKGTHGISYPTSHSRELPIGEQSGDVSEDDKVSENSATNWFRRSLFQRHPSPSRPSSLRSTSNWANFWESETDACGVNYCLEQSPHMSVPQKLAKGQPIKHTEQPKQAQQRADPHRLWLSWWTTCGPGGPANPLGWCTPCRGFHGCAADP